MNTTPSLIGSKVKAARREALTQTVFAAAAIQLVGI
jgi:hypothetical protein